MKEHNVIICIDADFFFFTLANMNSLYPHIPFRCSFKLVAAVAR